MTEVVSPNATLYTSDKGSSETVILKQESTSESLNSPRPDLSAEIDPGTSEVDEFLAQMDDQMDEFGVTYNGITRMIACLNPFE